ncbi:MAG: YidC/Oxa1 family membrane protein insertase [Ruminococcaceae bacterium]|nr:YidC/Oxa1 family membrane protein insertase [Oscillospiraceae bacterium]
MFLAFQLSDIVIVPFSYLLRFLYQLVNNYGLALILFTVLVKVILIPLTAKGKKSSMQMSRMTPYVQALRKKYENDPQKQNEAIQALYKEEGVSGGCGCLWSFIPLLILIPLYTIVREPITYILGESKEVTNQIIEAIKAAAPEGTFTAGNSYYDQMTAAALIPQYKDALAGLNLSAQTLGGVKFDFLGIDLARIPDFNIFAWKAFTWANIGAFLLPVLSAGSQMFTSWLSQKMNNSVITNDKGLQDTETAKNSDAAQTGKYMLYMMPIMTLIFGFSMPAAISVYWFIQGIVSTVIDVILTKIYRKSYDEEDHARRLKALQEEAEEAEKERVRAERRAANPDGITENTSKKKMQQKAQKEKEAAKAAAAREYAIRKGEYVEEDEPSAPKTLSGIPDRPFCKGRAYDPNRYSVNHTEE